MNTQQQRPTPETDAALLSSDCTYNCSHNFAFSTGSEDIAWGNNGVVVLADFARKLERERDEARERADSKHGLWMSELSRVTELEKQLSATQLYFDEARKKLEAMREALEWILNSASDGSIPDGRNLWAITQKAQQTLAKL